MCQSTDQARLVRFDPFAVVRCRACGLHYLSPRLPERAMLELYDSSEYYEGGTVGYESYSAQEPSLRTTFERVVRQLVDAGMAGGDLLEIGCGQGFFLDAARSAFRSSTGTEYSQAAVASARARGLDVVAGGIDELPPEARYDCIFSGHVLEHVYEPRPFVAQLVARLRPNGVLVLGTPDMGSVWRRVMGSRWPSYKIPEHVTYFDRTTLRRLLDDSGLEDVKPFDYRHAFPIALVLRRLGLGAVAGRLGRLATTPLWLPATTLAMSGRKPATESGGRQGRADSELADAVDVSLGR
jgi:SAM-dependent methyltransferase